MRKLLLKISLAALSLMFVMAPPAFAAGGRDDRSSEQEIRTALADWVQATNQKNHGAASTIWAPGMVGWFPGAPEFAEEAAFALAGLAPVKGGAWSTYELAIDEVAVSGSIAAVHDVWTETLHISGSQTSVRRTIRGSELWRLQSDGKWRIARFVSAPEKWEKAS